MANAGSLRPEWFSDVLPDAGELGWLSHTPDSGEPCQGMS